MNIKQELQEIKNKDLSTMSEKELREYKTYLEDLNKNADVKSKSKKWNKINKIGGTAISLVAAGLMVYTMYYLFTSFMVKPILFGFFSASILLSATNMIRKKSQKTEKFCKEIQSVCNSKLVEVDRQIAVIDFKKELHETKDNVNLEANNTVKQELNNKATTTVNNVKDQGIER